MAQILELTLPLKGVSETTGEQVICWGLVLGEGDDLRWMVIEGSDGRPAFEQYEDVRIDWRYDAKEGWVNVGVGVEEGHGQPEG